MANYIDAFNAFIGQLNLPGIRVISSDLHYHLHGPKEVLREGIMVVDPGIEEFYRQVEYMHAEWLYDVDQNAQHIILLDPESNIVAGRTDISSLTEIKDNTAYELIDHGVRYKIFDQVSSEELACFKLDGNRLRDELFWMNLLQDHPPIALNVSLEQYLTMGFEHYFMYGWQKAAFLGDAGRQEYIAHYAEQLFHKRIRL